jgi:hypothetical protein
MWKKTSLTDVAAPRIPDREGKIERWSGLSKRKRNNKEVRVLLALY